MSHFKSKISVKELCRSYRCGIYIWFRTALISRNESRSNAKNAAAKKQVLPFLFKMSGAYCSIICWVGFNSAAEYHRAEKGNLLSRIWNLETLNEWELFWWVPTVLPPFSKIWGSSIPSFEIKVPVVVPGLRKTTVLYASGPTVFHFHNLQVGVKADSKHTFIW